MQSSYRFTVKKILACYDLRSHQSLPMPICQKREKENPKAGELTTWRNWHTARAYLLLRFRNISAGSIMISLGVRKDEVLKCATTQLTFPAHRNGKAGWRNTALQISRWTETRRLPITCRSGRRGGGRRLRSRSTCRAWAPVACSRARGRARRCPRRWRSCGAGGAPWGSRAARRAGRPRARRRRRSPRGWGRTWRRGASPWARATRAWGTWRAAARAPRRSRSRRWRACARARRCGASGGTRARPPPGRAGRPRSRTRGAAPPRGRRRSRSWARVSAGSAPAARRPSGPGADRGADRATARGRLAGDLGPAWWAWRFLLLLPLWFLRVCGLACERTGGRRGGRELLEGEANQPLPLRRLCKGEGWGGAEQRRGLELPAFTPFLRRSAGGAAPRKHPGGGGEVVRW